MLSGSGRRSCRLLKTLRGETLEETNRPLMCMLYFKLSFLIVVSFCNVTLSVFASRELTTILERLDSSQRQRDQAEAQLSEVQNQTSSLPRAFPWPGLGERRQALEQVRSLQEQTAALAPALATVRTLVGGSKAAASGHLFTLVASC